jgi:hypothetical protein
MAKDDIITTPKKPTQHVWVKDRAGNEYICSVDVLKDPKHATKEELENCVDDAKVGAA